MASERRATEGAFTARTHGPESKAFSRRRPALPAHPVTTPDRAGNEGNSSSRCAVRSQRISGSSKRDFTGCRPRVEATAYALRMMCRLTTKTAAH